MDDPDLLWRAATQMGIDAEAAAPAVEANLVEFGSRVQFPHPLVRSVVYGSATPQKRRAVHAALAAATDPQRDPDRRAWQAARFSASSDDHARRASRSPSLIEAQC